MGPQEETPALPARGYRPTPAATPAVASADPAPADMIYAELELDAPGVKPAAAESAYGAVANAADPYGPVGGTEVPGGGVARSGSETLYATINTPEIIQPPKVPGTRGGVKVSLALALSPAYRWNLSFTVTVERGKLT